ncbi:2-dehydro-3-deoxy-D-gluconate 5-dehydrogenase KduD [Enterovibrio sp. ZSDZ35]|uniref:2-dehydro-3-deoxy-D-gluconate 5-dehydrogenase KduD n=1 Tax=Enterovibrio qingdaonensis TaxID=2899818 RepID=A0ABT5QNS9_9GAMM|nr:2-dehydro-3-deoxy-D-gluconate 5-dehydrogenase KduD [Enterovibrio sp. ZSDZ35]MDD1782648.1 2-dehydro-3-deoxy-D-gluconate 5-dehydrogenase KduD [Enterovibrio sp. ZSDZ35]
MILESFGLAGKVAVVTGCNTGLGQGMAVALAQAGADIVGINYGGADDTPGMVEATGRRFYNITADLSNSAIIDDVVAEARGVHGKIDILVNNAGIIRREDAINFSEKDWDDVMDINIKSVFLMSQSIARVFNEQGTGGKIVNIASMLSYQGGIRVPSYTASKSAVMGLTRALANEWASNNINVNAIAPGYMATNNTEALRADVVREKAIRERIPANRWGTPEDVGGAAVFLSSKAADYINGFTLAVDGGWLAR